MLRRALQKFVLALAVVVGASSVAHAQGSGAAEQLFLEGRALMQAGRHAEACAKFKASHALDLTATGTLLNLAICHEQTGKLASAWAEFRQVAAESAGRREDRVALAREHEAKLAPLLAHVKLSVPDEVRVPGLSLQLDDGDPMAEASWGVELPIDAGDHLLVATAPGKLAAKIAFRVPVTADTVAVTVPPLVDAPPPQAPIDTNEVARQSARRTRRILGGVLAGAGVIVVGVGFGFGAKAGADNDAAVGTCPGDLCLNDAKRREAEASLSDAKSAALVANVLVGGGAALVVGGAVLLLTSLGSGKRPAEATTAWRLVPSGSRSGGGLTFAREF